MVNGSWYSHSENRKDWNSVHLSDFQPNSATIFPRQVSTLALPGHQEIITFIEHLLGPTHSPKEITSINSL